MARVPPPDPVLKFLLQYKCTPEDRREKRLTHTWLGDRVTTYNIPKEKYNELYDLIYHRAFLQKRPIHLIERFTDPSVLKIDLDFEFPQDTLHRVYTNEHVQDIIRLYSRTIQEYVDTPIEKIKAYVFERTRGYSDKGKFKDGIHIMYPEIVCGVQLQKLIREKFLETGTRIFDKMGLTNRKYDDVVDESIIDRNGWMMYGSTKVAREPYLLTHVYNYHMDEDQPAGDDRFLIEYLSIHNDTKDVSDVRPDKKRELLEFGKPKTVTRAKAGQKFTLPVSRRRPKSTRTNEDLDIVKSLVALLSDYRAHEYHSWIEVGLCLFNIDDSLLETWIDFSKKSSKFVPGTCEQSWIKFKYREEDALGIGSLHRWAQLDDPVGYEEVKRGSLATHIEQSMNCQSFTVAKVVYEMYKYQFICTSIKHHTWYEFKNHRWHETEAGIELKKKLSNDVLNEYLNMSRIYSSRGIEMVGPSKQPFIDRAKKLFDVILKLQDISFKDKVMKECEAMFYDKGFMERLDAKANLICFDNGVYDLSTGEFRNGRPEDYCSLSTRNDYVPRDELDEEDIEGVKTFMQQVFPVKRVREYVWKLMASFLLGANPDEKFHFWTGSGGNGKSKLIELYTKAFGDYVGIMNVAFFTQKRASSSAASPEVAKLRGKRFISIAEPDRGQKINVGLLKEYSGGDKIQARPMYKEPFEFKPQFKFALLCNDLPKLPPDDQGTWRRVRVVKFISRFCQNPKKENEYMIDPYLADKFEAWKEAFMWLLLEHYKSYDADGIKEPPEVKEATKSYQRMADTYTDFLDDTICEGTENDFIKMEELYFKYKSWYSQNYGSGTCDNMKRFKEYLSKKLGAYNPARGWQNIKFRRASYEDAEGNPDEDGPETEKKVEAKWSSKPHEEDNAIEDMIDEETIGKPSLSLKQKLREVVRKDKEDSLPSEDYESNPGEIINQTFEIEESLKDDSLMEDFEECEDSILDEEIEGLKMEARRMEEEARELEAAEKETEDESEKDESDDEQKEAPKLKISLGNGSKRRKMKLKTRE